MQTLINTLNGLTLNHYNIAQYCSLNSNTDRSTTEVALLEIKATTLDNIEETYDAWDQERNDIHEALRPWVLNSPNDYYQVTNLDSTTIYKSHDSGHTLTICEGDCTMHIMLTRCMD